VQREQLAAEADGEDRFQARGDGEHPDQHVSGGRRPHCERQDRGARGERGTDALGEALRWPGDVLRFTELRGHLALRQPADRAQPRPGEDARPEPVGERDEEPQPTGREDHDRSGEHDARDDARSLLVHRIGKPKNPAHV
jgi:hypothetical protein